MKLRILSALILIQLLLAPLCAHAGFQEGKSAYDRKEWMRAIAELRPLAETGDDRAMIILGNMYGEGFGVAQDYKEAMSLYSRAAIEKNNTDGMVAVAAMYTSGLGVKKNANTALQWFLRAAQLGDQTGAFFCATILFGGNKNPADDIQPDIYAAYKWFKISADMTKNPKMQRVSREMARRIAKDKLPADQVAKADQEIAAWKPVTATDLGAPPSSPVETGLHPKN